jgi:hypothetical protein
MTCPFINTKFPIIITDLCVLCGKELKNNSQLGFFNCENIILRGHQKHIEMYESIVYLDNDNNIKFFMVGKPYKENFYALTLFSSHFEISINRELIVDLDIKSNINLLSRLLSEKMPENLLEKITLLK